MSNKTKNEDREWKTDYGTVTYDAEKRHLRVVNKGAEDVFLYPLGELVEGIHVLASRVSIHAVLHKLFTSSVGDGLAKTCSCGKCSSDCDAGKKQPEPTGADENKQIVLMDEASLRVEYNPWSKTLTAQDMRPPQNSVDTFSLEHLSEFFRFGGTFEATVDVVHKAICAYSKQPEPTAIPVEEQPSPEPRGAALFAEALQTINGDRQDSYGNPEDSFEFIARLWDRYLEFSPAHGWDGETTTNLPPMITASDVANMMILLKVARQANKHKHDNLVDIAGYAALANDINENKPEE